LGQTPNRSSCDNSGLVHRQNTEAAWAVNPLAAGKKTSTYCCLNVSSDLFTESLADADSGTRPPANSKSVLPEASIQPVPANNFVRAEVPQQNVQWRSLMRNSFLYLGVMHTFRIATEQGTRDGLQNQFFSGYLKALGAMHGWSDGDGYYENYLGHPIEGAVSSYNLASQRSPLSLCGVRAKPRLLGHPASGLRFCLGSQRGI